MTEGVPCNGSLTGLCQKANGKAERLIGEPQDSGLAFRLWRDMEDLHFQVLQHVMSQHLHVVTS